MLPQRTSRCLSRRTHTSWSRYRTLNICSTASFSTSSSHRNYESTIQNLKIGSHTRVIFQGFTGKQATANAQESIAWGTNIVGGVKPNGSGEHLGLPVLPSVRKAMEELKPDATGIYVAAHQATAAIEEAIEAEVPLIVAVAEHIPLHDIMRIHSMLNSQSKSRLVGANAPGIISAIGKCRIGFQPLPTFSPGHIGIVAKSGTLSYETVASLTRAGLGQSLCIGMGGDVIAGTNHVDALKVFEHDEDTETIILVGELGGTSEEEAADWIRDYRKRVKNPKPIAAVIAGFQAAPGRIMGHAGAWTGIGEGTAESKSKALADAGVTMVDHPAKFGDVMKDILAKSGRNVEKIRARHFPFDYRTGPTPAIISSALAYLQLDAAPPRASAQVIRLIESLWRLYVEKEAIIATVKIGVARESDDLEVWDPELLFDDAAFKSGGRLGELFALRDTDHVSALDREAEDNGIVYIPLFPTTSPQSSSSPQPKNLIGTLVNGAGLALNTNDALHLRLPSSPSANFLDTGGKATAHTIATSFKLILSDPRVAVVFVNIFGGLTLCDMIAQGIVLAFRDVGVGKPVVVRLRGSREDVGQRVLEEAGLPIAVFDGFEEAVGEVGRKKKHKYRSTHAQKGKKKKSPPTHKDLTS
ncbi:hypothetical protein P280DRAFT_531275 [Massarina eburnea CBS 473.64]|uniref:CoA-binding domain-containing protein n=1 Tax=Massarina eburnea CBS 473.64 TaxID=1395130 RepID=A0A6A6SDP3_9PLEO|nr:hypothetical protein P280DRAFT_531275 [Massarina eburnea CBS 473.64]